MYQALLPRKDFSEPVTSGTLFIPEFNCDDAESLTRRSFLSVERHVNLRIADPKSS